MSLGSFLNLRGEYFIRNSSLKIMTWKALLLVFLSLNMVKSFQYCENEYNLAKKKNLRFENRWLKIMTIKNISKVNDLHVELVLILKAPLPTESVLL